MITHNEIVTVLGAALSLVIFMLGYWRGHYRAYAECCDCCTCQTCTEWDDEDVSRPGSDSSRLGECGLASQTGSTPVAATGTGPGYFDARRTILLEPGPTIYPALAELAGEVMDGPHGDSEPIDSTWLQMLRLDWDRRYPIPQEVGR